MASRNNPTPARSNPTPARSNPTPAPAPKASAPVGASKAAVQAFAASNPNSRTAQAINAPKAAPTNLSQGIRIAATSGGSVGKKELQTLSEASGKSTAQIIQKLDSINERLNEKDKVGINLSSGAANMLIREASKAAPGYDNFLGLGQSAFGTGKIGQTLQGMAGSRSTGGYINPLSGRQTITPAVARTLLPRGMDLMPSGRQTVRGIGKQFSGIPTSTKGPYDGMMNTTGNDQGPPPPPSTDVGSTSELFPDLLPEEKLKEEETPQIMPGSSADLANWATGYKAARSSRKRAGRPAQGLASQRMSPTGSFRGGM